MYTLRRKTSVGNGRVFWSEVVRSNGEGIENKKLESPTETVKKEGPLQKAQEWLQGKRIKINEAIKYRKEREEQKKTQEDLERNIGNMLPGDPPKPDELKKPATKIRTVTDIQNSTNNLESLKEERLASVTQKAEKLSEQNEKIAGVQESKNKKLETILKKIKSIFQGKNITSEQEIFIKTGVQTALNVEGIEDKQRYTIIGRYVQGLKVEIDKNAGYNLADSNSSNNPTIDSGEIPVEPPQAEKPTPGKTDDVKIERETPTTQEKPEPKTSSESPLKEKSLLDDQEKAGELGQKLAEDEEISASVAEYVQENQKEQYLTHDRDILIEEYSQTAKEIENLEEGIRADRVDGAVLLNEGNEIGKEVSEKEILSDTEYSSLINIKGEIGGDYTDVDVQYDEKSGIYYFRDPDTGNVWTEKTREKTAEALLLFQSLSTPPLDALRDRGPQMVDRVQSLLQKKWSVTNQSEMTPQEMRRALLTLFARDAECSGIESVTMSDIHAGGNKYVENIKNKYITDETGHIQFIDKLLQKGNLLDPSGNLRISALEKAISEMQN